MCKNQIMEVPETLEVFDRWPEESMSEEYTYLPMKENKSVLLRLKFKFTLSCFSEEKWIYSRKMLGHYDKAHKSFK